MGRKSKMKFAVMVGASLVLVAGLFSLAAEAASASDGTTAYSGAPGARASFGGANGTELFLGGNYIELGISNWGDFGTEGNKPGNFRGTLNGEISPFGGMNRIGMSTDYDGYNNGRDLPIDFYLPGTPEERFAVGYQAAGGTFINSNSALMSLKNMATTVSDASVVSEGLLKANILSTWSGRMEISQSVSFKVNDKFYRNEVTIKNLTDQTWTSARYMRSMDPDNTVFRGGSSATANTVTHTFAEDGKSVVKAETSGNGDPMYVATGSRMPFFFYSKDPAAKASVFGFSNNNPYINIAYDTPRAKGSTLISDAGITLTWDAGELAPGASKSFVYYSSLDERDFEEVEKEIEETKYPVNFSVIEPDGEANGTLTASVDEAVINSSDEVVEGKSVVFTAAPAKGYHIKEWKLNDTVVEVEGEPFTGNVFTVESLLNSENVTVEFELTDSTPPVTEDDAPSTWQKQDVTITLTASDAGSGVKTTYYQVNDGEPQTGTTVQIIEEGTHTVTYWSIDEAGNIEEKNNTTVNIDKTAPTLKLTPNTSTIWPPNNKLVDINIVIDTEGGLSGMNTIVLTSITSNEDSENDIQDAEYGTFDTNFKLRAKREGNGTGRIYTIMYTVTDQAGNVTVGTVTIDVPHDKGKQKGN